MLYEYFYQSARVTICWLCVAGVRAAYKALRENRPNFFLEVWFGSVITVFTWISKYISWISKQYPHFHSFFWFLTCNC